jgi:hypothetical protein
MRSISTTAIILLWASSAIAQQIIEPEACILDTLKGNVAKDSLSMVHRNCVRQYIRATEKKAVSVPVNLFSSSTLSWYAQIQAFPTAIPEKVIVHLKNNSQFRIIFADLILQNKKTKSSEVVRSYAIYPIEPMTVGDLEGQTNTGANDFQDWTWALDGVYGVAQ